jgi:hypothetical protein
MPFKIMHGRGDEITGLLAWADYVHIVADCKQSLKRHHDFVVFHEIADDDKDSFTSHW